MSPMPIGHLPFYCFVKHTHTHWWCPSVRIYIAILVNCRGQIRMFNSLVEEALRQNNIAAILTKAFLMCAARKMSHFSMSQSSPDSSAIPRGAHLVGFSCLCFSQSTLLALPLPCPLSFFLCLFLSLSGKVHTQSQVVRNSGVSWWKPRGNVLGITFILLKTGPFFSFVFSMTRHSCLHNSIPTALQMDFPPLFFLSLYFAYSFVGTMCAVVICLPGLVRKKWNCVLLKT